jgi:rare lipoprotein A
MAAPVDRSAFGLVLSAAILMLIAGTAHAAGKSSLRPVSGRTQIGKASYYGGRFDGRTTASGTKLRPNRLTAASKTLPLGTKAKVTNLENGKAVDVIVTDRGPHARHRILDVSPKAAARLGMKGQGVVPVKVKPVAEPKSVR